MLKRDGLKMAHVLLDEELEKDSKIGTKLNSNKQAFKNEICDLERKLEGLERKMHNIDVQSNESEERQDSLQDKIKFSLKESHRPRPQSGKWRDDEEEDSENEESIYAKIEQNKRKRQIEEQALRPIQKREQNVFVPKVQSRDKSKERKNSLKNSVRSIKSIKSNQSKKSMNSKRSYSIRSSDSTSRQKIHHFELENAKEGKRLSNLEKQLSHYKRLTKKLQQKLDDYRVMEIEYKKLQANFNKSEQIRKQQKKIIDSFKKH